MDGELNRILSISQDELGKGSPIALRIVEDDHEMCEDMADTILSEVSANNAMGKKTVFIWPVGPVGQYPIMASRINAERISMKNVYVFQMDEYLDNDLNPIPESNPLSFTGFLKNFFAQIDHELAMPADHHFIPVAGDYNWEMIQQLGGVDTALGGIGINGHIAFNEPPEKDEEITDEAFKNLKTRVLRISRETRTINSYTAMRGAIELIPQYCVTIGMKEILSARKIRFYMNREWQSGIVRKLLHGPVTRFVPSSFFQEHSNAKLTITKQVATSPVGKLR